MKSVQLTPIGKIHTPFRQKFGIPRQPGLVAAPGVLELFSPWDRLEYFEGLESVSHLWVVFLFHEALGQGWRGRVRPPRLGGNQRLGVFATRSPFRPNHLGWSVVRLERIHHQQGREVRLEVNGVDMLDGTPLLDIKPYLPYADSVPHSHGGFAEAPPQPQLAVQFLPQVEQTLPPGKAGRRLRALILSVIGYDPRPAYRKGRDGGREYRMELQGMEVRWRMDDSERNALVTAVIPLEGTNLREDGAQEQL